MGFWVGLKLPLPFDCPVDLNSRDLAFLLQPMRDYNDILAREEIQNAEVDPLVRRSQFMNAVPQQIRKWAS